MKHAYFGTALAPLMFLWLLLPVRTAVGQGGYRSMAEETGSPVGQYYGVLSPHIEGTMLGFHFAVDFEELPQPLKPARGTITMTRDSSLDGMPATLFQQMGFDVSEKYVDWLSERIVDIPSPMEAGDVHTLPIEFTVLESGQVDFSMYWVNIPLTMRGYEGRVVWCINGDGDLEYLGSNLTQGGWARQPGRATFFDQDSVRILQRTRGEVGSNIFAGYCKIEPPFKIGEPSTVCFNIEMVESHAYGLDLEVSFGHMLVSDYPEPIKGPVYAGETFEICLTVVPLPVRELHDISLSVYDEQGSPNKEVISITSLFADDGTLRYISNGGLDFVEQDSTLLPKSFPSGTKATCGSHWIRWE